MRGSYKIQATDKNDVCGSPVTIEITGDPTPVEFG
jgi:hypothetical protein